MAAQTSASDPVVAGSSIGRSRHAAHPGAPVVEALRRCATCKLELASGVTVYCDDVCRRKFGLTHHSPGRTAARRSRRRSR